LITKNNFLLANVKMQRLKIIYQTVAKLYFISTTSSTRYGLSISKTFELSCGIKNSVCFVENLAPRIPADMNH
jgi:hypothetical protein